MILDDMRPMANAVRFLSMDAITRAGYGHEGTPLGCAELATALFARHLSFNPADPRWFDRDRFVLSAGHGSMLLYSLLHLSGYQRVSLDHIRNFHVFGSICHGHPERDPDAGIEVTTGPLGQGIGNAAGMAIAEAILRHWLGEELVNHRTYVIAGDGCLQEGVGQEIISLAGHLGLGHLTVLWDNNRNTADGPIELAQSDDVPARFRLSGWHVQEVDGQDPQAVSSALALARHDPRPSMIACRTTIGYGIARIEGRSIAHSGRIHPEDCTAARERLSWPYPPFEVPADIRAAWLRCGERSRGQYAAWQERLAAASPEKRELLARLQDGQLPEGWDRPLLAWRREAAAKGLTQNGLRSSGDAVERLVDTLPELVTASADLDGTTQHKRELRIFTAADQSGRYIPCGVREHAMAAIMNGMAAHGGIRPLGTTFLAFSDYERPAMRMAALMGLPALFVFTHDSISVGKLGPTHQPVEQLAALRAMPNMLVFRPADAVEAAECWQAAIAHCDGPSTLVFSRQPVAPVRTNAGEKNLSARGAYVLAEADGPRRATLLATGAEVEIAMAARTTLQAAGVPTAVVSMPCWELFEQQSEEYCTAVIPPDTVRVAVEAASRLGWDRWIGEKGAFVGMNSFGASGPEAELLPHFGITADRVAAEVQRSL